MNKKLSFSVFIMALVTGLFLAACGAVPAGAEVNVSPDGQSALVEFTVTVESIGADQWLISGQTILVDAQTVIDSGIAAGDLVQVKATVTLDGRATAQRIELASLATETSDASQALTETVVPGDEMEFIGVVETIGPESWTVSGEVFLVNTRTEIKGPIAVGDTVKVHASPDGTGSLTAREIERTDGMGQPSSDDSGVAMEFTGVVQAISPDAITVGGRVFAITSRTEVRGSIAVGDTVKVEAFGSLGGILTASEIKKIDASNGSGTDSSLSTEGTDDHGGATTESTDDHGGTEAPAGTDDHGGDNGNG